MTDCITERSAAFANKRTLLCAAASVLFFVCSWHSAVAGWVVGLQSTCAYSQHMQVDKHAYASLWEGMPWSSAISLSSSSSGLLTSCMISSCQGSVRWLISFDIRQFLEVRFITWREASMSKLGQQQGSIPYPFRFLMGSCSLLASTPLTWSSSRPWLALKLSTNSSPWSLRWNCSVFPARISPVR